MKKVLFSIFAMVAVSFSANAQLAEIEQDLTPFTTIDVSKNFEVTVLYGTNYSAFISASTNVSDYIQVFEKGKTLYVSVDEKSFPKELKKSLQGKNAIQPTLKLTVYAPSVNKIILADGSSIYNNEVLASDALELELKDNASVKNLAVEVQDFELKMGKKSNARLDVKTNNFVGDISGQATLSMAIASSNFVLDAANSAQITANGEMKNISVKTAGGSSTTLTGTATKISVQGKGSSSVLADGLVVSDADVVLDGSNCEINAKDNLKVEITGHGKLIFNGSPAINVTRIENSSMIRTCDVKKK